MPSKSPLDVLALVCEQRFKMPLFKEPMKKPTPTQRQTQTQTRKHKPIKAPIPEAIKVPEPIKVPIPKDVIIIDEDVNNEPISKPPQCIVCDSQMKPFLSFYMTNSKDGYYYVCNFCIEKITTKETSKEGLFSLNPTMLCLFGSESENTWFLNRLFNLSMENKENAKYKAPDLIYFIGKNYHFVRYAAFIKTVDTSMVDNFMEAFGYLHPDLTKLNVKGKVLEKWGDRIYVNGQ